MATTYYLLAGTDGSYACGTGFPSGGNRWRMSETAPSTSTTSITISQSSSARFPISTETTEPPGASGGTGTHTATLEVNSGDSNIDLTAGISPHQTQIQRFTSSCGFGGGTIVPDDTLPITLTAGTYTLTWTDACFTYPIIVCTAILPLHLMSAVLVQNMKHPGPSATVHRQGLRR